jgi:hypothetical protein
VSGASELAQRLLWGRTRADSEAQARREAFARDLREATRKGECFVVHDCETHKQPTPCPGER